MIVKQVNPAIKLVLPQGTSSPSIFTLAVLAAVGYGGYRVYKHFRKG